MNMYSFLNISFNSLNLFSFVLGMVYAYLSFHDFNGRKHTFTIIVVYFIGVALYYYLKSMGMIPDALLRNV